MGNYSRERETAKFESVRLEVSFIDASEAHLQHTLKKRRLCNIPLHKYPYCVWKYNKAVSSLIVFLSATNRAATMRKHIPPQSLFFLVGEDIAHCPLTVPSGDTPCLTAGDARRANPWRSVQRNLRRRKHCTAPTLPLPGFYFSAVTSSRCHTLSITAW